MPSPDDHGAKRDDRADAVPARVTDRFTIDARVGEGSSGEVWAAHDRVTGERVALKRLHAFLDGPEAEARFAREAALLARVASPNVVRCLGHGVDEAGRAVLVLEWIEGVDLARRMRGGRPEAGEALAIARGAARGLATLHEAGVVHGDVKPSNFLLAGGEGGAVVKLVDLDVARAASLDDPTPSGLLVGTPAHLAPEQARGATGASPATDQFALGTLVYELFAGRRPFDAVEPLAVLASIALAEPPPLDDVAPEAPACARQAVARALAKSPAERFPSVRALEAALGGAPFDAPAPLAPAPVATTSVLFAAFPHERSATDADGGWKREDARLPSPPVDARARLEALVTAHGGVAHAIAGEHVVALFTHADATVAASRAARAALGAASLPGGELAIATGPAGRGQARVGASTLERAAAGLAHAPRGPVHLDDATARALGPGFLVEREGGVACLRPPPSG